MNLKLSIGVAIAWTLACFFRGLLESGISDDAKTSDNQNVMMDNVADTKHATVDEVDCLRNYTDGFHKHEFFMVIFLNYCSTASNKSLCGICQNC